MNQKKEIEKYINQANLISTTFCKIASVTSYRLIRCGLYLMAKNFDISKYKNIDLMNPDEWTHKIDWKDFSCEYSVPEFCNLLNISDGTYQRTEIKKAISGALKEEVLITRKNEETGEIYNDWYTWFVHARYIENPTDKNSKEIKLQFNPGILGIALDHQNQYSHLELEILGSLSSVYALRIYELIKSYYNTKSKYGNKKGEWKTKWYDISQLRAFLDISPIKYKGRTDNLINKAVKEPIEQINSVCRQLKKTLHVSYEEERGGRGNGLKRIRFVGSENQNFQISKNDSTKQVELKRELNKESEEIFLLKEKYSDKWDDIIQIIIKNEIEKGNPLANDKNYKDSLFCEGLAIQYIRENLEN
ncbi:MAG: replication initiation protein [Treponema sp.]|nr:replication initiation protein [Treponema sp.]